MAAVALRDLGTTGTYAPQIKRGTARLATGQTVMVVPDTNRTGSNGADITGVAKMYVYMSTDIGRTAFTLQQTYTPAVAPASSTRQAVMSIGVRENNTLYVVYQGTDNSLRLITFAWSGSAYGAGSEQTIVAAGAITNRFRCVDIDCLPTNANLVVAAYEAAAANGQGAYARVYARMADNTTWTRAFSHQFFTTQFIRDKSEDICISWNKEGATSNVAQMALFYTKVHTTGDDGDTLREISFNVSTGTQDSATSVGTWYSNLHQGIAPTQRRAWLFAETTDQWVFGAVVGASLPFFLGMRLNENVFTGLIQNRTPVSNTGVPNRVRQIIADFNPATCVGAEYSNNRLLFGYAGLGYTSNYVARSVMIRFSDDPALKEAISMDLGSRILDNAYTLHQGVLGIYGGANKHNYFFEATFTFMAMYGASGNTVSNVAGVNTRKMRSVGEDFLPPPEIQSPNGTVVSGNNVTFRVQGQASNVHTNVNGKLGFELATDAGFSLNFRSVVQPDSEFISFSATNSIVPPIRNIVYTLSNAEKLFPGTWYMRAFLRDDLAGSSNYSSTVSFTVSHPPVASPTSPVASAGLLYGAGNVTFSWDMTDTEVNDTQSAYQVIITRVDTGASVHDSGKVTSSNKFTTIAISSGLKDVPLQWTVALWDSSDTKGPFSTASLFTLMDAPTVSVTTPTAGATVTTALPTVAWSFVVSGTRTQRAYRVRVWNTDAAPDEEVADTGWVFSAASTHTFDSAILDEGVNYRVDVYVQDTVGLTDDDSKAFITDWLEPLTTACTLAQDDFKVTVSWTNAGKDVDWVGYRVYRRYMKTAIPELDVNNTATTWELLAETTQVLTNYTYYDYTAPLNKTVQYVVVQLADRFGSLLESVITTFSTINTVGDRYYFVPEVPVGSIASFEASYVVDDSFSREIEQNQVHVIGRGRQVQIGDDLGYGGTLTFHLRNPDTARSDREFLEYLSGDDAGNVYMRTPFGDVLYVSLGNVSTKRIPGMGNADIVDLTVPYIEVYREAPITRAGA